MAESDAACYHARAIRFGKALKMNVDQVTSKIQHIVSVILKEKGIDTAKVESDASLYENGLGFDSMDAAVFSTMLDAEFGKDPYSVGEFPHTIADVIKFYANH